MTTTKTRVSLVLGGARSGKSSFAENLCHQSGKTLNYVATSQVFDDEMKARIDLHQARRGKEWRLIEEPINLCNVLRQMGEGECVLVDCLTLWLSNLMMAEKDVAHECDLLVETLKDLTGKSQIILVSNEVGQGIVPMEKMARDFRDYAGRLHQNIAALADHVWFVTAGLPQQLKP